MLWYRNIKTGNMLSPANKMAQELMETSPLYEPVRPAPVERTASEPAPPEEPKAAKRK